MVKKRDALNKKLLEKWKKNPKAMKANEEWFGERPPYQEVDVIFDPLPEDQMEPPEYPEDQRLEQWQKYVDQRPNISIEQLRKYEFETFKVGRDPNFKRKQEYICIDKGGQVAELE